MPVLHIAKNFLHFLMHFLIPLKNIVIGTIHSGKKQMVYIMIPLTTKVVFNQSARFKIKLKDPSIIRIPHCITFIFRRMNICPFLCTVCTKQIVQMIIEMGTVFKFIDLDIIIKINCSSSPFCNNSIFYNQTSSFFRISEILLKSSYLLMILSFRSSR